MRPVLRGIAAAVALLAATGCASAGSAHRAAAVPAARPAASTATRRAGATGSTVRCPARVLVLRPGTYVSPVTGEHAELYSLRNRGSAACTIAGYPRVVLYSSRGAVLPFHYVRGGGAYATPHKPATVVLGPGASAWVLVAKYRCDLGEAGTAARIKLTLRAAHGVTFAGRATVGGLGSEDLSYCRGEPHDPGQMVDISPIEPTQSATSSFLCPTSGQGDEGLEI